MERALNRWLVAGAAVAGRRHAAAGVACQDRVLWREMGGVTALALADGAGSARFGARGAEIAVSAACDSLLRSFPRWSSSRGRRAGHKLLRTVRRKLAAEAAARGAALADFATTLLCVATDGRRYVLAQVGDGALVVESDHGWERMWPPPRGEFANETVFVTCPAAESTTRWVAGPLGEFRGFAVMSDGSATVLVHAATGRVAPAVAAVGGWQVARPPDEVSRAIGSNIRDLFLPRTSDDCSLGIMRAVRLTPTELLGRSAGYQTAFLRCGNRAGLRNRLRVLAAARGCPDRASPQHVAAVTGLSERTVRKHLRAIPWADDPGCQGPAVEFVQIAEMGVDA